MKPQRNILVSFSGGLDSTFLVYDNLKKGNTVTGLYTTIENNRNKVIVEKNQIKKLEVLFNEDFPGMFRLEMGISYDVPRPGDLIFHQITLWLVSLLYHNSYYDEIQIGAVMNDDMVSYIDDIKKMWGGFKFLNDKLPSLTFPLTKNSKLVIAGELPKKYKDLVVYCEDPRIIKEIDENNSELEFENCQYCHSCKRYKFDSDYMGIEYGQIKPRDYPYDVEPMIEGDLKKAVDITVSVKKTKRTVKNNIKKQKVKRSSKLPLPITGFTLYDPNFKSKRKKNDIRRPRKR